MFWYMSSSNFLLLCLSDSHGANHFTKAKNRYVIMIKGLQMFSGDTKLVYMTFHNILIKFQEHVFLCINVLLVSSITKWTITFRVHAHKCMTLENLQIVWSHNKVPIEYYGTLCTTICFWFHTKAYRGLFYVGFGTNLTEEKLWHAPSDALLQRDSA